MAYEMSYKVFEQRWGETTQDVARRVSDFLEKLTGMDVNVTHAYWQKTEGEVTINKAIYTVFYR